MYQRIEIEILKKRIKEPRKFVQVIMGPRQVGKTTLISQLVKQIEIPFIYESADSASAIGSTWMEEKWTAARTRLDTGEHDEFLLIIDEIQKISNWSESLKKFWDEDSFIHRQLKVIILGSSRLLLQQGLTESMAGRFETIFLPHWSFSEMHNAFGLDEESYAWFGGYPGGAGLIDDEGRWKSYIRDAIVESSISRDILMLTRIDKPALLKNLFEMGCLYSGQILSYTKMQGQLHDAGNTTTLAHYMNLLNTSGLLAGLAKFSKNIIRKRSSSPKFQVYNNALLSAQDHRMKNKVKNNPAEWGRIIESSIGTHLLNFSFKENYQLSYWREGNYEVDFIIEKQDKTIAIEVKSGISKNTKGMEKFKQKFSPHKIVLIDDSALSWKEFLKMNPGELF